MKNMIIAILISAVSVSLYAQDMPAELECTPSHEKALFSVEYYLTSHHLEEERISTGTDNIPVEQISHVNNPNDCEKLNKIIKSNQKFSKINSEPISGTKFYYQTDDFYFIFWTEVNKIVLGGPKSIFIVINKQTDQISTCYI